MPHPVKGIDHVFLLADDLDTSLGQYRALGFTVSPRGLHSAAKGTANHTIVFPNDYFELLGIVAETEGNQARRDLLRLNGQGLHAIACRIENAAQAQEELAELGIDTHGLNDFARPVPLADGGLGEAAFSTLSFGPNEVPLGMVFMCQHKTPDAVWLPELRRHENGAVGLSEIIGLSEAPEETARRFARLFADGRVKMASSGAFVSTGENSAKVMFVTPTAMVERYPDHDLSLSPKDAFAAVSLRVEDMDRTRAVLDRNAIDYADTGTALVVAATEASGAIIEFRA